MAVLLFAVWLVLNAHFAPDTGFLEIALFGLAVSGVLCAFVFRFTRWNLRFERFFWCNLPRLLLFALVLLREILLSNFRMLGVLVSRKSPEPVIVSFDLPIKSEMLRSMVANAITLTPGTITIVLTESHFVVHCLNRSFIEGFEDGTLVRLAEKMDQSHTAICGKGEQS